MKKINIYLVANESELNQDKKEIGNFIRDLNDKYEDFNIYFKLTTDNDEIINKEEIKNSELFFILFCKEIDDETIEKFNIAYDSFKNSKNPKISTYIKKSDDNPGKTVIDFMQKLDQEIGHYYNNYDSIDTIKLNLILKLKTLGLSLGKIETKEGKLYMANKEVMSLENIPIIFNNKDQNINYVVVSAGEDSNNFNIAIALRRYFLVNNKEDVLIDVAIENAYKNKNIKILKNEDKQGYDINTFGSIEETYFKNSIIDLNIEERARLVHSITWSNDIDFVEFNKSEYNKKSSRAVVVHIPYKLYSVLLDDYTGDIVKDLEAYKEKIKDANVVKQLAENEHDRWMAYMYADGYKVATMEDIRKYYVKMGNNHKHTLAKLHPALVRNDELAKVEKDLADLTEELTGERNQKDFTKVDYKLVQNLDKIELDNIAGRN